MGKLRVFQSIEDNVWELLFTNDIPSITQKDKELIKGFGEPTISVGGTYLADTENEYTLPVIYLKVISDLPYTQKFDARDADFSDNTSTKVLAYRDDFVTKFTAAFTTLRNSVDNFTGEQLYTI